MVRSLKVFELVAVALALLLIPLTILMLPVLASSLAPFGASDLSRTRTICQRLNC